MLLIILCRYHTNCYRKRGFYLSLKKKKKKKGKKISQEKVDKVIEFYCNDESSKQIPGKKISWVRAFDSLKSKKICYV